MRVTILYEGPDRIEADDVDEDEIEYNRETGHWQFTVCDSDYVEDGRIFEDTVLVPREKVYRVVKSRPKPLHEEE